MVLCHEAWVKFARSFFLMRARASFSTDLSNQGLEFLEISCLKKISLGRNKQIVV